MHKDRKDSLSVAGPAPDVGAPSPPTRGRRARTADSASGLPRPASPHASSWSSRPSWRGPWQKPSASHHSGNASTAGVLLDKQPFMK